MSAIPFTAEVNPSPVDLLDGLPEARPGAPCKLAPPSLFEIVHESTVAVAAPTFAAEAYPLICS